MSDGMFSELAAHSFSDMVFYYVEIMHRPGLSILWTYKITGLRFLYNIRQWYLFEYTIATFFIKEELFTEYEYMYNVEAPFENACYVICEQEMPRSASQLALV